MLAFTQRLIDSNLNYYKMGNETIFEAAQNIVRRETVSFSVKQFNETIKRIGQSSTTKTSTVKVKSSQHKK